MAFKLMFFVLLAVACQAQNVEWLEDHEMTYLTNDHIGTSMTVPKWIFDELQVCTIQFPNLITYEAFPNSNLPSSVNFEYAVPPFTACSISFKGVPVGMSGTYQLNSLVRHVSDNSTTFTRQRFLLTVHEIEPWSSDAN